MTTQQNKDVRLSSKPGKQSSWATFTSPVPQQIMAFRGFGNRRNMHLQGRVRAVGRDALGQLGYPAAEETSGQFAVALQFGSYSTTTTLTQLGDYSVTIPADAIHSDRAGWQNILVVANTERGALTARHRILFPQEAPSLLVICDLDGTVLPMHSGLINHGSVPANSRTAWARFAMALSHDVTAEYARPVFCISGQDWDGYQSSCQLSAEAGLPEAPILLHPAPSLRTSSAGHLSKGGHVKRILDTYSHSPAALLTTAAGASQPALSQVLADYGDRFCTVYVVGGSVAPAADAIARLQTTCADIVYVDHPSAAARHAHRIGLIDDESLSLVQNAPL